MRHGLGRSREPREILPPRSRGRAREQLGGDAVAAPVRMLGLAAACVELDLVLDDDLDPNVDLDGDDDV